jgi:2-keto-4-pentenoate hydratase
MTGDVEQPTIDAVAADLRAAYDAYAPIKPVRDRLEIGGIDAAYRVQQRNTDHWTGQGRRVVGRKIGLTSEAVQRQLGVDQPDFGALFDDMRLDDGDMVPYRAVLQPRIEAEVALVLNRPLDDEDLTVDQLAAAVDHLLPALEVVGSRIVGWDITILDTIADNASSGMFVLGTTPIRPDTVELRDAAMTLTVNSAVASTGSGAACLGHPYNAALWLARRMVAEGTPLQPGDVVMTGALGPMVDLNPGDVIEATIQGVGAVRTLRGTPA